MSRILSGLLATRRNDVQRLRVGIGWRSRGEPKDANMKMHSVIMASVALLISGMASGQQQYDSSGSPTPAPNQSASPNSIRPNIPIRAGKSDGASGKTGKVETNGSGSTTGSATSTPSNGGVNGPVNTGTTTPTDPGATPSGLSPD
jgi:hypothetical protein